MSSNKIERRGERFKKLLLDFCAGTSRWSVTAGEDRVPDVMPILIAAIGAPV